MTQQVLRSADRFTTTRDGSSTRYCFSFGHHYDPANVSFGPVVAVNEETVRPGGGFDPHPHAGLVIVTYVVTGSLAHEGISSRTIGVGEIAVLRCGPGVVHAERNAGATELRFVQTWLSTTDPTIGYDVVRDPVTVNDVTVLAGRLPERAFSGHLFVATGSVRVGNEVLTEGDTLRTTDRLRMEPSPGAEVVLTSFP
ncbi:MAG: Pirin [Frankiales bacterium]|nr:Pirin [Frankiales bacterium]